MVVIPFKMRNCYIGSPLDGIFISYFYTFQYFKQHLGRLHSTYHSVLSDFCSLVQKFTAGFLQPKPYGATLHIAEHNRLI